MCNSSLRILINGNGKIVQAFRYTHGQKYLDYCKLVTIGKLILLTETNLFILSMILIQFNSNKYNLFISK